MSNKRGFTLVELLIVIGIIGFLAAAILVAVDPVKRIQDSRNCKRTIGLLVAPIHISNTEPETLASWAI